MERFALSDARIRGIVGPFGSGKSVGAGVIETIKRAMAQRPSSVDGVRRSRWFAVRNTYRQLDDSTMRTFFQWFPPSRFGKYQQDSHNYLITAIPGCEIEVWFRALDRPDQIDNLLSVEYTGGWLNEAREIPWEIVSALDGRIGRYPPMSEGGCSWYGWWADTNPPDYDSWWYELFEERRAPGTEGEAVPPGYAEVFHQPSGLSPEAENLPNLVPGYYESLAVGKPSWWVDIYVHGKYGQSAEGRPVHPLFDRRRHVRDSLAPYAEEWIPFVTGWDFGLTPAVVIGQISPSGQVRVYREVATREHGQIGLRQFCRTAVKPALAEWFPGSQITHGTGDPAGRIRSQTDEVTGYMILASEGFSHVAPAPTNAWEARRDALDKLLALDIDGEPGLLIDASCKTLIKGLGGSWNYRRVQVSGEARYQDKPDKNIYSHVCEALQYLALTAISPEPPKERKTDLDREIDGLETPERDPRVYSRKGVRRWV